MKVVPRDMRDMIATGYILMGNKTCLLLFDVTTLKMANKPEKLQKENPGCILIGFKTCTERAVEKETNTGYPKSRFGTGERDVLIRESLVWCRRERERDVLISLPLK